MSPEYEVNCILSAKEEIYQQIKENKPDIILLDTQLKGQEDAIETAVKIKKCSSIPIIYIMDEADNRTFNRAMITRPAAFISKPFKKLDLQRAIELAIYNNVPAEAILNNLPNESNNGDVPFAAETLILSDRIFVHCRDKMIKIMIADIMYIEADRNYSRIFTPRKEFLLSTTLKTIEVRLPKELFIRIHRSYIINISLVDEVGESYVLIMDKQIPLSAALREQLLKHIQTI